MQKSKQAEKEFFKLGIVFINEMHLIFHSLYNKYLKNLRLGKCAIHQKLRTHFFLLHMKYGKVLVSLPEKTQFVLLFFTF
jgi:hypothetical protein